MRMMRSIVFALIALLPRAVLAQFQSVADYGGVISGSVVDAQTREPVVNCNVMLDDLSLGVLTDSSGRFVIRFIPPGTYRLVVADVFHQKYVEDGVIIEVGKLVSRTILLEPAVLETGPIVVTATRRGQTAKMAPASVTTITSRDIDRRQRTTFDQTIESSPGVFAFRSTPISVQSMSIRGSSDVAGGGIGNRVLLLVDGRPALTSDSGGAFWSLVPTNFIDRIEVVKGAFSSLYGSTAMGGVVNVITRRPDYRAALQVDVKAGFFEAPPEAIQYTGETPMQSEIQVSYSGAGKRTSYVVSGSRKQSQGHAESTSYEFYDLFTKMLFDLEYNRNLELTLGGGRSQNDYPHTWLSSDEPLQVRPEYTDDQQQKRYLSADLLYWAIPRQSLKYSSRFYYYRHSQMSFFNEDDPNLSLPGNEPFGTKTDVDGNKIGNITQLDLYMSDRHYLIVGGDVQIDVVESSPDTVMYGDHQVNNFAVFAQDEIDLTGTMTATIGARYDWNHLAGRSTLEQFSPKLALVYSPVSRVSLRALYGRAFRAPTIAERFFQKELGGGIDFVPNPELTAERMNVSLEGGLQWRPRDALMLDAAVFRYEYDDLIYWENISDEVGVGYPLYQVRNLSSALMQGVELSAESHFRESVTVSANYTYLDARDRSPDRTDDRLAYRPEHSLNLALDTSWLRYFFHIDARYRSGIDEVFLYPLQAPAAFWVTNANLRYQATRQLFVSVTVNNLLDGQYEELARYRMPGRNWIFGLSLRL